MANTGKKVYTELEQYYLSTGQVTGVTKPNDIGDPNYIPPITDHVLCPLGIVYTASRTAVFFKAGCGSGTIPSPVTFYKQYSSMVSQSDANNLAQTDPSFLAEGQQYANDTGQCVVDAGQMLHSYPVKYRPSGACVAAGEVQTTICMTDQTFQDLEDITDIPSVTTLYVYKDLGGLIPADPGYYFGLYSGKSFFVDHTGMVSYYVICNVALPTINLSLLDMTGDGTVFDVYASMPVSQSQDITVSGRIDTSDFYDTTDGVNFSLTILSGQISGRDAGIPLVMVPGNTYYWRSAIVTPPAYTLNKMPI